MIHKRIQKQLSAYLDDELSQRRRQRVEKHLQICEECSSLLAELRETSDSVALLRQTASEDLWFALNARLESITPASQTPVAAGRRWAWERIYPIVKPAAAIIGIALIVGFISLQIFLHKPSEVNSEYTQMDVYLTAHTQYYSQKMLAPDEVINLEQQDIDTTSTEQNQQPDYGSELDFYLSVYLGEDEI
ncbi:MAG: anti-sigma factor family protein [Candidatus Poribacteria bacterium]